MHQHPLSRRIRPFWLALLCALTAAGALVAASLPVTPVAGAGTQLALSPAAASLFVGGNAVVSITLDSVTDLYGYQLAVAYDLAKVSASGAFVNDLFDTSTQAYIPGGWNATCAAGECRFAVTRVAPATAVSGSGTLARITFTGLTTGTTPLTFTVGNLSDRNGFPIAHLSSGSMLTINGSALITGVVGLQGRATPVTTGTVQLADAASVFAMLEVPFDAVTGAFTATVPVQAAGSLYNLTATHSVYLGNRRTGLYAAHGGTYGAGPTMLRAGDATNDGTVDILDLSCIGGTYDSTPAACGQNGWSDINADGIVNIFDLVLVGGNYGLSSPQPW